MEAYAAAESRRLWRRRASAFASALS